MYETRKEAENAARGNAVIQVDGGYAVVTWGDYFHRINEEAESLYDGGWTSNDKAELMKEYGFDEEHAFAICDQIAVIEEETL